jgi:hypothetical protein
MITSLNMAYYREEDWERFLESIDDRDKVHDTWEEWHDEYLKAKTNIVLQGLKVTDWIVDIDELQAYCKDRGFKNTGEARAQFVGTKAPLVWQ